MIEEMLAYNREFVKNEGYKEYITLRTETLK